MDNEIIHKTKLINDITKSITYWSSRNTEYMLAYTHMLHIFTVPKQENKEEE